ncbi:hypothetical protein DL771_010891 [Monosporascus sp. 5C6A]|nr:hypothetical protein DL771_010891 [Monosporascus sp. 5C6A]
MEDDLQASDLVTLVVQHFKTLTRGPYGVVDALQVAKEADPSSTPRIILDESELAWRAYFSAKKATELQRGFIGKANLTRLLNDLSTQPIEEQRAFARQLARAVEDDTGRSMESDDGPGGGDSAVAPFIPTTMPNGASIYYTGPEHCRLGGGNSVVAPFIPTTMPNGASTYFPGPEHYGPEQVPGKEAPQKDMYIEASLKVAKELFPTEFMDSIRRIPSTKLPDTLVADISMLFQKGHMRDHFGCQMIIEITEEKVAWYALRLFDVQVEVKDGVRFLRYPGGGKVQPDPSIRLQACRRDIITCTFGAETDRAISASPICQREEKEERDRTDGVSMTISNQAMEGAKITVYLGEWRAANLKKKLYD